VLVREDKTCAGAPTQIWYGKHDELMQGGEFYQACLSVDFGGDFSAQRVLIDRWWKHDGW
jgi:hypothetical protein